MTDHAKLIARLRACLLELHTSPVRGDSVVMKHSVLVELLGQAIAALDAAAQPEPAEWERIAREDDSDPAVRCPYCGCCDEATVTLQPDTLNHLTAGAVHVVVPVWTCSVCAQSWTGHRAETIRDGAVRAALNAAAQGGEQ